MNRIATIACLLAVVGCASAPTEISEDDRTEIYLVLERQRMAWNAGDLDDFMDGYHRSDSIAFGGGGRFHRGWFTILDRYRAAYPEGGMGLLAFSELEIESMGADASLVRGRWSVEGPAAPGGGVFSLVFRRTPDGWRIAHDHSSAGPSGGEPVDKP